jgi:hypothetical protein
LVFGSQRCWRHCYWGHKSGSQQGRIQETWHDYSPRIRQESSCRANGSPPITAANCNCVTWCANVHPEGRVQNPQQRVQALLRHPSRQTPNPRRPLPDSKDPRASLFSSERYRACSKDSQRYIRFR